MASSVPARTAPAAEAEASEPCNLYDNPDIEFLPPTIPVPELAACLADESAPIAKRMRTVFLLKQIAGHAAIDALKGGMTSVSVLLKHEIAYGLGQLQDTYAVPFLEQRLRDPQEHSIVRHEVR
jgi:HEAT repeat protein